MNIKGDKKSLLQKEVRRKINSDLITAAPVLHAHDVVMLPYGTSVGQLGAS